MRIPTKQPLTGLALLAAATLLLSAHQATAAGLLVADGGFGGQLAIEEHDVRVTINNGVAVTELTQVFRNQENRIVEALYTFPVPEGASVANFSMWINGQEMIGEVVEKQRARQIYESYKQTRRDPGLLEQVDYKRFEMRIFPIAAGGEQRIRLEYYQELNFDHDAATYVYPLATSTAAQPDTRVSGKFALALAIKSEVPLVEVSSPSHGDAFVTAKHTPQYFETSYEAQGGELSQDIVLNYRVQRPRTGLDLITSKESGEDGYFQITMTAGEELDEAAGGMDYVFVVDTSGSMANDGKLRLSRECIAAFVSALSPEDRLELLAFNISPTTLFAELQPVTDENLRQGKEFLDSQRARGGTALRPAVQTAYKYQTADRPLNVVILSDGMTEQQEQAELVRLIQQSPAGVRLFCVGVGNDVNRPLLAQIAEDAGGLATFVSHGDDFQRQAESFRRKLTRPAGTDLKLTFTGGDVYDVTPKTLPNLFHGAPLRIYGRYRQGGSVNVQLAGDVLGGPLQQDAVLQFPQQDDANPEIERMWAYRQMESLLREARAAGDTGPSSERIANVVRLGEEYSIVSEYTSFIVLENDAEYRRWKIERQNVNRVGRDRRARGRLREQLASLQQQALESLGPVSSDAQPLAEPAAKQPATISTPTPPDLAVNEPRQRSFDLQWGQPQSQGDGGGGGGAIDPITALVAGGLAGSSALAARRRKRRGQEVE